MSETKHGDYRDCEGDPAKLDALWWAKLGEHQADIRECVRTFGQLDESPHDAQMRERHPELHAAMGGDAAGPKASMADWDAAVRDKNVSQIMNMMSDAWYKAPDRRDVYEVPGFAALCNLQDGTFGEPAGMPVED